ncbi:MAG: hypothetical protein K5756_00920 [Clostridiales bacterium]|nr:hypothetical protein [Clostridiales bacterium]
MKKYFSFIMAVMILLLVFAACGKNSGSSDPKMVDPDETYPATLDYGFATEAPDSRLPEFKGDIKKLMNNYYIEVEYKGETMWAAGIDGNFYLSDPELAGSSYEAQNVFSKNCSSSIYDYLYEYYEFLKEKTFSVTSVSENFDEIIGRKAHKVEFASPYGYAGTYYLDAEYGFCLKQIDAGGHEVFEVKDLKIGSVKYEDLKWEDMTTNNYIVEKSNTTENGVITSVVVQGETTTKEPVTLF